MKITKKQLKRIIREEKQSLLREWFSDEHDPKTGKRKKKTCTTDLKIAYNRFMQFVEGKRKEEFLKIQSPKHSRAIKKKYKDLKKKFTIFS